MKAFQEHIETGSTKSLRVLHFEQADSDLPWHFHSEIEIVYFLKGSGRVLVNDFFELFSKGDIILIGSKIPHVFLYGKLQDKSEQSTILEAYVIQFSAELFNFQILQLPEFLNIKNLLLRMKFGLKVKPNIRKKISELIIKISESEGIYQITTLIEILELLSKKEACKLIRSNIQSDVPSDEKIRMQKIISYIQDNYNRTITLNEIANHANMNRSSFCIYFRQHFRKTFTEYLNELRVGYACKLLVNNKLSVSEIAFQVGYNDISYFIGQFKKLNSITPLQYRIKYSIKEMEVN
jgi:YesN/AraC family two-component response regulator